MVSIPKGLPNNDKLQQDSENPNYAHWPKCKGMKIVGDSRDEVGMGGWGGSQRQAGTGGILPKIVRFLPQVLMSGMANQFSILILICPIFLTVNVWEVLPCLACL